MDKNLKKIDKNIIRYQNMVRKLDISIKDLDGDIKTKEKRIKETNQYKELKYKYEKEDLLKLKINPYKEMLKTMRKDLKYKSEKVEDLKRSFIIEEIRVRSLL